MRARENILARIGKARGPDAAVDVDDVVRRHPRGPIPPLEKDLVKRFNEQATRLASDVMPATTLTDVPKIIAGYLRERQLPLKGVCWPSLAALDWRGAGLDIAPREGAIWSASPAPSPASPKPAR